MPFLEALKLAATYQDAVEEARVVMRTRRKLAPNEKDNFGSVFRRLQKAQA